jgi:ATP-binding cassette, subfamily B, bacterial MsbA
MPHGPAMTASTHSDAAVYRRLLRYSAPHWQVFSVALLGMILFALVDTAFIRLLQPMLDSSFVEQDAEVMRVVPLAILALFVLRGLANFMSSYGMAWVSQRVVLRLRGEVFDHLLRLPVAHYDRVRNADLLVKLTYQVQQVAESATQVVTAIIKDGLTILGMLAVMLYMSWKLTLIVLCVAPFVAGSVRFVSKRFKVINKRLQASMGGVTHVADEAITGRRVVKIYGGQEYEASRFREVNEFIRGQSLKLVASSSGAQGVVQLIAAVAVAVIVHLAISGDTRVPSPGTFAAFMAAMLAIRAPLNAMTAITDRLTRGLVAAADVFQFLDTTPESPGGTRTIERARGEVAFQDVHFSYGNDKAALGGITLAIQPGQTVAFVGRSGSGKSTLCSLLPRFYDPTAGRVLLDGHDVRDYRLADLRRQMALVDQNVVLFNATVAENIAYGVRDRVTTDQIIEAARAAYAWDFIEQLEGGRGLDTMLGQNGVNLSGGQRQRIAIARALLRNAPILILDEATSALDTESERYIQQALERLVQGRTTMVIAHRLSTVQRADLIAVMQDGRIIETGRHDELLAHNGLYAALYQMQFDDV